MMASSDFIAWGKDTVRKYVEEHTNPATPLDLPDEDIYLVWYCKTLQNHKALFTTALFCKMYYEFTYNGDSREAYLDAYVKCTNQVVKP